MSVCRVYATHILYVEETHVWHYVYVSVYVCVGPCVYALNLATWIPNSFLFSFLSLYRVRLGSLLSRRASISSVGGIWELPSLRGGGLTVPLPGAEITSEGQLGSGGGGECGSWGGVGRICLLVPALLLTEWLWINYFGLSPPSLLFLIL